MLYDEMKEVSVIFLFRPYCHLSDSAFHLGESLVKTNRIIRCVFIQVLIKRSLPIGPMLNHQGLIEIEALLSPTTEKNHDQDKYRKGITSSFGIVLFSKLIHDLQNPVSTPPQISLPHNVSLCWQLAHERTSTGCHRIRFGEPCRVWSSTASKPEHIHT